MDQVTAKAKPEPINAPNAKPQPCGDSCPILLYLSGDVAFSPLQPDLAPGVRRCSAIALRLGVGVFLL
jgi:hypothetical protein